MGRSRPRWVIFATALVSLLVVAACGESDLALGDDGTGGAGRTDDTPVTDASPDEVVELALDDLQDYWSDRLPDLYGVEFEPLAGGLVPYGPDSAIPQCGEVPLDYTDIAENALYCPTEDLIAWDRVNLIPGLQEDYGPLTVGIVMAHEFAHAIQARGGVRGETVTLELQADCYAGAWVSDAADRIAVFDASDDQLDDAVGGFLELRDSVGVSARNPQAHGSGFDRVSAFQDGFERGNDVCVGYEEDPPPVVAIPFLSVDDAQRGGNLPIDQLVPLLTEDLDSFYDAVLDQLGQRWEPVGGIDPVDPSTDTVDCGDETFEGDELRLAAFYCVADNTVYIDNTELVPALAEIGDFAFGGEIARQYAFSAQVQLGLFDDPAAGRLHADCLTGVYGAAAFAQEVPTQEIFLSPGDLDEIIIAFLSLNEDGGESAFDRVTAFRTGFVDGLDACGDYE